MSQPEPIETDATSADATPATEPTPAGATTPDAVPAAEPTSEAVAPPAETPTVPETPDVTPEETPPVAEDESPTAEEVATPADPAPDDTTPASVPDAEATPAPDVPPAPDFTNQTPHQRYVAALAAVTTGQTCDDSEAVKWVQDVADEHLLIQYFNGWDDLEQARSLRPALVDRSLLWMRAQGK
jgi:hypothetical protein